MVNQNEMLQILNRERDYEDKIATDLMNYIKFYLKDVRDITQEEKKMAKEVFSTIASESIKHSQIFTKMIEDCIQNGEHNY